MAKAKSGGTRSYLRGRIANDVYSIGKDAKGKKQQVVRSLAESVANPQTLSQMRGRMIMSTVMQVVSGLSQIIDHSFDGVANGQPSISEFIRTNYALLKEDVASDRGAESHFQYNDYQVKGALPGAYVVSQGKAVLPAAVGYPNADSISLLTFNVGAEASKAGAIRSAIGMGEEDFVTFVGIHFEDGAKFFRVSVTDTLADSTEITASNVAQLFSVDNPFGLNLTFGFSGGKITINDVDFAPGASGVIFSEKVEGGFDHSSATLFFVNTGLHQPDKALATYPVGEQRFLNGGEL